MGPYAWIDGPSSSTQLANAVAGGSGDGIQMDICRATLSDGVHPGKFFNGQCNIGWGGTEVVKKDGYQILVNTQPSLSKYLPQSWLAPGSADTFNGGSVGSTNMKVCRASYNNGWHPGKVWEGKCNIGYGGKELAVDSYQLLSLTFNKTGWQSSVRTGRGTP